MKYYHRCLGGSLYLQTVGDSPQGNDLPKNWRTYILYAELRKGGLLLSGSDLLGENGLFRGNAVSLHLICRSERELRKLFDNLSVGGEITQPVIRNEWQGLAGGLRDRFGNHWVLSCKQNAKI